MATNISESKRLIEQGRKTILVCGFVFGVPLVVILIIACLQYVGTVRLEACFIPDQPEMVDRSTIDWALVLTGLLVAFFGGSGIVRGFVWIQRGKKARQQAGCDDSRPEAVGQGKGI